MAQLARQKITEGIVAPTANDADTGAGDKVTNHDGKTFLLLQNPGASAATATITAQATSVDVPGLGPMVKADLVVDVNSGEDKLVGPFPATAWNDSGGDINIAYAGAGAADINVSPLVI